MKRQISLLVALLMIVSLLGLEWTKADAIIPGEDASPSGEKIYCNATLEDDFAPDRVLVVLTNAASTSLKTYGLTDFTGYGFKSVTNLTSATTALANAKIQGKPIPEEFATNANVITFEDFYDVDLETFNQILCLELKNPGKQNVLNAIKILEKHPDVKYAGPDYYMTLFSGETNDTYVDEQWALNMIDLPEAWEIAADNEVLVGVIDSGIDTSHPDLEELMIPVVGNPQNQFNCMIDGVNVVREHDDSTGHGTMVAGIIAAVTDNDEGIAGGCRQVELFSLKVCTTTSDCQLSYVINAINVASANNIPILNFSGGLHVLTGDSAYTALYDAIRTYNGLFICAAGNFSRNLDCADSKGRYIIPAVYNDLDNLITVGASTTTDENWAASNFSATRVDLFAPGENIISCFAQNICQHCTSDHFARYYHKDSGTSYAAPYVTAVAAMILSKYWLPSDMEDGEFTITPAEIKERIMYGVDTVYDETINIYGGKCVSGGRLNAYKALHDHIHTYICYNDTHHKYACSCGVYQLYTHSMENVTVVLPSGHIMIATRCAECDYEQ